MSVIIWRNAKVIHTDLPRNARSAALLTISILQRLDLPPRLRRISLRGALLAAMLMEWRARFTGREPLLTRYTALILARTQTYDISRAKRNLGYQPLISVAEGVERTSARS